ncbi:hypothetical protein [Xylanimonas ulmi]|uniref:Uncharacterized protein n=1 Tax=Xylanimonas ulmi TaxID=228973 RepID=A0A4Q7M6G1_9MICO|nr:hypothetical protein [Xylanibacterium ulmi]RZS61659.1 hypothetical protein EV386_1969 [Xylanibacterium ulmi]
MSNHRIAEPVLAPVPRPRVPVKWDDETKRAVTARCHHCDYAKHGRFPAELDLDAQHHRTQHRAGTIPVTRGPATAVDWQAVQS